LNPSRPIETILCDSTQLNKTYSNYMGMLIGISFHQPGLRAAKYMTSIRNTEEYKNIKIICLAELKFSQIRLAQQLYISSKLKSSTFMLDNQKQPQPTVNASSYVNPLFLEYKKY
jgi:hypothetical protein